MSPFRASSRRCTTIVSPSRIPASIIESPWIVSRKSAPRPIDSGTATTSSTFSSASSGEPAATRPSSGRRGTSEAAAASTRRWPVELDRAGLRRVALDQPDALEVREMGVYGRGRREADLLADLAHGRRVAVVVDVRDEELPDLLLTRGERGLGRHGSPPGGVPTNVCSSRRVGILPDGVNSLCPGRRRSVVVLDDRDGCVAAEGRLRSRGSQARHRGVVVREKARGGTGVPPRHALERT